MSFGRDPAASRPFLRCGRFVGDIIPCRKAQVPTRLRDRAAKCKFEYDDLRFAFRQVFGEHGSAAVLVFPRHANSGSEIRRIRAETLSGQGCEASPA